MAVGVEDRRVSVLISQVLTVLLAVGVVAGTGILGEVGALSRIITLASVLRTEMLQFYLMDEGPALGVSTGDGSIPEGTAEVDNAETIELCQQGNSIETKARKTTHSAG